MFVFTLFSGLAIFIAVIGIVGLILITIGQNLRELGIRKALGAEISDVSGLLSRQLTLQFLMAGALAVPLSYYGYKNWVLRTYIYRIDLDFWLFAAPVLVLLTVIFMIILVLAGRFFG